MVADVGGPRLSDTQQRGREEQWGKGKGGEEGETDEAKARGKGKGEREREEEERRRRVCESVQSAFKS